MGLFSRLSEPVFLKEEGSAQEQLSQLEALLPRLSGKTRSKAEHDVKCLQYGIYGENQIIFELKNSHMPMFVLHDLFLEDEDQSAQIDFYIITQKLNFMIECKNLYGNIEITRDGSFVRTLQFGGKEIREGLYSPVTQNERHLELLRKIRGRDYGPIRRAWLDKSFYTFNKSLIVLANPKTVLDDSEAPEDVRRQVIRADQLVRHIKTEQARSKEPVRTDKEMETAAQRMLARHREASKDYIKKYELDAVEEAAPVVREAAPAAPNAPEKAACPKCGAKLVRKKGPYGWFWACSGYPECKFTRRDMPKKQ